MMTDNFESALPPEILDIIFGLLSDDSAALKACSKVGPAFSSVVERYLYRHLNITTNRAIEDGHITPSQLENLVDKSAHIAIYVHSLRIVVHRQGRFSWLKGQSYNDEKMHLILPQFSQLRRVELAALLQSCSWNDLHSTFRPAFLLSLRSSLITEVVLRRMNNFPLSALNNCTSLGRLMFDDIHTVADYEHTPDAGIPHLESLSICQCWSSPKIIHWAMSKSPASSSSVVSELRHLVFKSHRPSSHMAQLNSLVEACSPTLKALEVDLKNDFRANYNLIDSSITIPPMTWTLSSATHLECLTIHTITSYTEDFMVVSTNDSTIASQTSQSALHPIRELLQTLPSPRTLRSLVLDMSFHFDSAFGIPKIDWWPLYRAIEDSSHSTELRVSLERSSQMKDLLKLVTALRENPILSTLILTDRLQITTRENEETDKARL